MKRKSETTMQSFTRDIGRTFKHPFDGLMVEVKILDVKFAFGTWRYLVSVAGQDSNTVWIYAPAKPKYTTAQIPG